MTASTEIQTHAADDAILTLAGVTKHFGGSSVLEHVSLMLKRGHVHSIIGPNGAGKTTLINCVTGWLRPTTGTVHLEDREITGADPATVTRLGVARTFQTARVFRNRSVRENVEVAVFCADARTTGWLGRVKRKERQRSSRTRTEEILDEVGLARALWTREAGELSLADQRRVEIGICIGCDPKVICLDEPTSGMGAGESDHFSRLVRDLGRTRTVVLVEHHMPIVLEVSDLISVLVSGRMLVTASPDVIVDDARVQDAYLGSAK